jgi:hypothetical protein
MFYRTPIILHRYILDSDAHFKDRYGVCPGSVKFKNPVAIAAKRLSQHCTI